MDTQHAHAVGILGTVGRPERLLVTWAEHRYVTVPLDDDQARTVAAALPSHFPHAPHQPHPSRQLVRWLLPPLDVTLHVGDGPPHFAHLGHA
ncbi:hypothetical protein ACFC1R_33885 [Kitasatospora sp. NPDC056138]|uniref:hypothetical protein n=1 Tax=Kitasatospora sp. NPDC056138 TaxID=3345724 RepID=UPI0035DFD6F2